MNTFKAFRIDCENGSCQSGFQQLRLEDLSEGEVVIRAAFSGINYKDALAATGKGKILKVPSLVGGIDVAGVVESSLETTVQVGDRVVVCGCGLSETRDGGFAEYVRVPADCVVQCPDGLGLSESMAIGSAGFSAALAIDNLQRNRQTVGNGPVVVSGATGGVGSFSIDILARLGFEVTAITGKPEHADYLRALGAATVIERQSLEYGDRPLEKAIWGGAIDSVGGELLSWLTRTVKPGGNIASVGLAGGTALHTTVMPFILRGINLLGVDSVHCGSAFRKQIWARLASDLRPRHIDRIVTRKISLGELPQMFDDYIDGRMFGRCVVEISSAAGEG